MGYGAKKNSTFMESEGLICCWSLKNLEVQINMFTSHYSISVIYYLEIN